MCASACYLKPYRFHFNNFLHTRRPKGTVDVYCHRFQRESEAAFRLETRISNAMCDLADESSCHL